MPFLLLTFATFVSFLFIIINIACETVVGEFIFDTISDIPYGDKTLHIVISALLTYLLNGAMNGRRVKLAGRRWLMGSLIVVLFVTLEECSQAFIPARHFDMIDMVCNYAGIYAGGLLIVLPRHGHKSTVKANERIANFSFQTIFHRTR